jgi:predicted ArsR family transcriptional regulator
MKLRLVKPKPKKIKLVSSNAPGKAHRHAPETSAKAASDIADISGKQRLLVYKSIENSPDGMTDAQLEADLGIQGSSVRPRRKELQERGLIEDSGLRRTTPSGRQAVVWKTCEQGEP